jgi:Na+-driven multidrug efflux pump
MVRRKVAGIFVNAILNYIFVFIMELGIWGIAAATSITYWFVLFYGIFAAKKIKLSINWKRHMLWSLWIISGSMVISIFLSRIGSFGISQYVVIPKFILIACFTLLIGLAYPGPEKHLVKNAMNRTFMRVS